MVHVESDALVEEWHDLEDYWRVLLNVRVLSVDLWVSIRVRVRVIAFG